MPNELFTSRVSFKAYYDSLPDDARLQLKLDSSPALSAKLTDDKAELVRKSFTSKKSDILPKGDVLHYITAEEMDRDNEVVLVAGIKTNHFPGTVFYNHNYDICVGKSLWARVDAAAPTMFIARTRFIGGDVFSDRIKKLYSEDIENTGPAMNGWSIGFIPIKSRRPTEEDRARFGEQVRTIYEEVELIEYSAVGVQSNRAALTVAVGKAFGKDGADALVDELTKGCPYPSDNEHKDEDAKALTHGSTLADSEPDWSDVDKTKLPEQAFVTEATGHDTDSKSTWRYPHHFVVDGETGADGVFTSGDMYLHRGGLNAAYAAAMGAHTGERAEQSIIDHLVEHREALGTEEEKQSVTAIDALQRADPAHNKTLSPSGNASVHDIMDAIGHRLRVLYPPTAGVEYTYVDDIYPTSPTTGQVIACISYTSKGGDEHVLYDYTYAEGSVIMLTNPQGLSSQYIARSLSRAEHKEGRVLSGRNRTKVRAAVDALQDADKALTDLLDSTEKHGNDDAVVKLVDEEEAKDDAPVVVRLTDDAPIVQKAVPAVDAQLILQQAADVGARAAAAVLAKQLPDIQKRMDERAALMAVNVLKRRLGAVR